MAKLLQENRDLRGYGAALVAELRRPMGTLRDAMAPLFERAGAEAGESAERRVSETVAHMFQLASDIERLARVESQELERERLDLGVLADKPMTALRRETPRRHVIFTADDNLVAHGDARLLQLMLDHLLRSAWKFTSRRAEGRIHLGRSVVDGEVAFYVEDNGIGFDTRLAGKLSRPFVRLHYEKDLEGSGLGLFIARRIVERHGGQLWANSSVDFGATFFFNLPTSGAALR